MRTHRPDFRYAGDIEDEIQQAYYVTKPYELAVIKVIFKLTGSPVYDRLKDLPPTTITTLGGIDSRQVCLSKARLRTQNRLTLRCPDSCITPVMIRSALMFRLLKFGVDVISCVRQDKTNLYRISITGDDPPYELVSAPKLTVRGVDMCINFDKHPLTCDNCFDVHHTPAECMLREHFCRQCRRVHPRGLDCSKSARCTHCGILGHELENCPDWQYVKCGRCYSTTHARHACSVRAADVMLVRKKNRQT